MYSTGCPKCRVLAKKLDSKNIQYTIVDDVNKMLEMGIVSVPYLKVDDVLMNYKESVEWVNKQ